MPMRLSGLNSGLDTDSIVQALVTAYSTKKTKVDKQKTSMQWKMDSWNSLNQKITNFYSKFLGDMRFSQAYNVKKTTVSDPTKATIVAGANAVSGTQTVKINQTSKSSYVTGDKLQTVSGNKVTDDTKMSDLAGFGTTGSIGLAVNGKTSNIELTSNTTVKEFVNQLKNAGVGASFDATNQRIFVNSQKSGAANDFSLVGRDSDGMNALKSLGLLIDESGNPTGNKSSTQQLYEDLAAYDSYPGGLTALLDDLAVKNKNVNDLKKSNEDDSLALKKATAEKKYAEALETLSNPTAIADAEAAITSAESNLSSSESAMDTLLAASPLSDAEQKELKSYLVMSDDEFNKKSATEQADITTKKNKLLNDSGQSATLEAESVTYKQAKVDIAANKTIISENNAATAYKDAYEASLTPTELTDLQNNIAAAGGNVAFSSNQQTAITNYQADIASREATIKSEVSVLNSHKTLLSAVGGYTKLKADADNTIDDAQFTKINDAVSSAVSYLSNSGSNSGFFSNAKKVYAQDAEIELNGAVFTSSTDVFNVNGLSITALQETNGDELTINTTADTQAVYDTIKGYLKEYNTLINEMSKLYNAGTSKGFEPLTDEEKEQMSEKEIENWEEKIKDSLLRRDDNLSGVMSILTDTMSSSIQIGNKNYSLSTFGINTMSYFTAPKDERNAFHIDGDKDDPSTSTKPDKLMSALASDPEGVQAFFSKMASNMYSQMQKKMGTSHLNTSGKFYNDKQLTSEMEAINKDVKKWEDKLSFYEEFYYKKFSDMETSLSKLQSQTNSLTQMLGG
jgi:flagellar hook-associated protein 2